MNDNGCKAESKRFTKNWAGLKHEKKHLARERKVARKSPEFDNLPADQRQAVKL